MLKTFLAISNSEDIDCETKATLINCLTQSAQWKEWQKKMCQVFSNINFKSNTWPEVFVTQLQKDGISMADEGIRDEMINRFLNLVREKKIYPVQLLSSIFFTLDAMKTEINNLRFGEAWLETELKKKE